MRKGRALVYRVYKRLEKGFVECYFCGVLVPEELLRFSAFGGEPMCPGCKRREREHMKRAGRSHA